MVDNIGPIFQNNKTLGITPQFFSEDYINSIFPLPKNRGAYVYSDAYLFEARNAAHKKVNSALARARSQVGKIENPTLGNRTGFISQYRAYESKDRKTPVKNDNPYCASFVSWCYGNNKSTFGYEKYTPKIKEKAGKAGFYTPKSKLGNGKDGTYLPKSGDLVMWINPDKWNPKTRKMEKQGGHVGMIESCRYDYLSGQIIITTIEGNTIPKGEAETATSKAQGEGPEGVLRKEYTLEELQNNPKMDGVVRMEDWLALSELTHD